jgi:hypothetical protein
VCIGYSVSDVPMYENVGVASCDKFKVSGDVC